MQVPPKAHIVQISNQEKEILSHLLDLIDRINPMSLVEGDHAIKSDSCGSEDKILNHLKESYVKVQCAFQFILKQILKRNSPHKLQSFKEHTDEGSPCDINVFKTPQGQSFVILNYIVL